MKKFTHPTFGEFPFVVETNGTIWLRGMEIARCRGYNINGNHYIKIKNMGWYRKINGESYLCIEGVRWVAAHTKKAEYKERMEELAEWLTDKVRNYGKEAVEPEPVVTPCERKCTCMTDFKDKLAMVEDMFAKAMDVLPSLFDAAQRVIEGALKYKEMYNSLKAQKDTESDTEKKLRKENIQLRVMVGEAKLFEIQMKYFSNKKQWKEPLTYEPKEIATFIKREDIYTNNINARGINSYLIQEKFQGKRETPQYGKAKYYVADFLGEQYATEQPMDGENGQKFTQLRWTNKGLALIIGSLLVSPPPTIEGTLDFECDE